MPPAVRGLIPSLLLLTLACGSTEKAPAPVDTSADEAAIRAIDTSWNGWLKARNDSAIAAIYAADAVLLPPNLPRVSGADAIRAFWAGLWPLKADLVLTPVTIRIAGDWGIEEGNYAFTIPAPGGDTKDDGKYLVIWRKSGGRWSAVQDIWNSDAPPPAVAAARKT